MVLGPLLLSACQKDLTVFHSYSTHMWVLQYLTGISLPPSHNSYPQAPRRREEPGRGKVRSGNGRWDLKVLICISFASSAALCLSNVFCTHFWGSSILSHRHVSGGWAS